MTTKNNTAMLIAAAAAFGAATPSLAQQVTADQPTSAAEADKTLGLKPRAADPAPYQPFADKGVTLQLNYTGEAATNLSGGLRRDAAYAGQIFVGADLDLDKIVGLSGGSVSFAITNRHGSNLSNIAIGNNTSVQEIWGTQNTHLAYFTYKQKLLGDRLEFELGRTVANISFLNSPLYCNFQSNSACGNPTFVFKDSNFTYFPASSWGGHATAHLTDKVYVHAGVYEVNPDRKQPNDHGFNFSTANATGVIMPFELGYGTDFTNDRLPRHYQIGGWIDRGDYSDPLRDANGGYAILTGQPYATRHGRSGAFFRFDQMLTRPDPHSQRGLSVFGVAMTSLSGRATESRFLELGVLQTGTFAGRDKDTLGFMINDQRFTDLALENLRVARVSAGGSAQLPRHEYMMELTYGAQIGPAMRLSPNIQYIVNPDQSGAPFRTRDIKDAFILGFKFTIDAPSLWGALSGR